MKSLVFASLLVLSSASVALAECQDGWCVGGCGEEDCDFVQVLSKNYPYVIYMQDSQNAMFKRQVDCQRYRSRTIEVDGDAYDGEWVQAIPGSVGEQTLSTVCNM